MRREPADFGMTVAAPRVGLSYPLIAFAVFAPIILIAAASPDAQNYYLWTMSDNWWLGHQYGSKAFSGGTWSGSLFYGGRIVWSRLAYHELVMGFYMFGWEFFFRGFLLNGFRRFLPLSGAILLQAAFFTALHIGKPIPEVISSFSRRDSDGLAGNSLPLFRALLFAPLPYFGRATMARCCSPIFTLTCPMRPPFSLLDRRADRRDTILFYALPFRGTLSYNDALEAEERVEPESELSETTFEVRWENGKCIGIVEAVGEVDLATVSDFKAALIEAAGADEALLIDLSRVIYMDSSGFSTLLEVNRVLRPMGLPCIWSAPTATSVACWKLPVSTRFSAWVNQRNLFCVN